MGSAKLPILYLESAPQVRLELTTLRLTAGCSAIELQGKDSGGRLYDPGRRASRFEGKIADLDGGPVEAPYLPVEPELLV